MKKQCVLLVSLGLASFGCVYATRQLVDKVVARVNGVNIKHSQLQAPQIAKNGQHYSLQEMVIEELWVQRGIEQKMVPTATDIEKQIIALKREMDVVGLADQQADEKLKKEIGIGFNEYRIQLERYQTAEMLKGWAFRSHCSVGDCEVKAEYENHKPVIPGKYKIKIATLSAQQASQWAQLKDTPDMLEWDSFEWMKKNELAAHLQDVTRLEKNQISEPIKMADGYVVALLEDKQLEHIKSLDECYAQIEGKLRREKIDRYSREMEAELRQDAVITEL